MYTLGSAARAAGVSKSTINRAIKRGTISARSKEGGVYEIDPAELHRVFPPVSKADGSNDEDDGVLGTGRNGPVAEPLERYATPSSYQGNAQEAERNPPIAQQRSHELEVALVRAEAQIEGLKAILDVERQRTEELRLERDRWAGMAEASQRQITDMSRKPEAEMAVGVRGVIRRWLKLS